MSETTRTFAAELALHIVELQNKQPTQESFLSLAAAIDKFIVTGAENMTIEGKPSFTLVQ